MMWNTFLVTMAVLYGAYYGGCLLLDLVIRPARQATLPEQTTCYSTSALPGDLSHEAAAPEQEALQGEG